MEFDCVDVVLLFPIDDQYTSDHPDLEAARVLSIRE